MSFSLTTFVTQHTGHERNKKRKIYDNVLSRLSSSDKRTRVDNEKTHILELEIAKLIGILSVSHGESKEIMRKEIHRYLLILGGINYNNYAYYYNLQRLKKYLLLQGF